MVVVEVVSVRAAAHNLERHRLPGNGKGDADGLAASAGRFHFVAGERIIGHCATGGDRFDADTGGEPAARYMMLTC